MSTLIRSWCSTTLPMSGLFSLIGRHRLQESQAALQSAFSSTNFRASSLLVIAGASDWISPLSGASAASW